VHGLFSRSPRSGGRGSSPAALDLESRDATARTAPVLVFFRFDDGVMTFGLSEKATVDRESGSTLRPCAWYLDEIDEATTEKVSGLVRTAFS
jgi:hypothetical protein